jgi:hypothetical protein
MSIVCCVKYLPFRKMRACPVARPGFLGFLKFMTKEMCDSHFGANRSVMPGSTQNFAKIEHVIYLHVQPRPQGTSVTSKAKTNFQ